MTCRLAWRVGGERSETRVYSRRFRREWLLTKIRALETTRSRLVAEAVQRVSSGPHSWSQMIFTDIFGPDILLLRELQDRITRIENNLISFQNEARSLMKPL